MFDTEYESPKRPKIPTLLQYCKTCGKGVERKTRFAIDIIWLPGQFRNYTLQTHAFRVLIPEGGRLFDAIGEYVSSLSPENTYSQPYLVITSVADCKFKLMANNAKKVKVELIGSTGVRLEE